MDAHNPNPTPGLEMAHVLFMDVVSYSTLPMDHQQRVLHELQEVRLQSFERRRSGLCQWNI